MPTLLQSYFGMGIGTGQKKITLFSVILKLPR